MGIFEIFRRSGESSTVVRESSDSGPGQSTRYKVILTYADGTTDEEDELFNSYEEADAAGLYAISCYELGGEILHDSNAGDYPIDEDDPGPEYEIVEVAE